MKAPLVKPTWEISEGIQKMTSVEPHEQLTQTYTGLGAWLMDFCWTELCVRAGLLREGASYLAVPNDSYKRIAQAVDSQYAGIPPAGALSDRKNEKVGNLFEGAAGWWFLAGDLEQIRATLQMLIWDDTGLEGWRLGWGVQQMTFNPPRPDDLGPPPPPSGGPPGTSAIKAEGTSPEPKPAAAAPSTPTGAFPGAPAPTTPAFTPDYGGTSPDRPPGPPAERAQSPGASAGTPSPKPSGIRAASPARAKASPPKTVDAGGIQDASGPPSQAAGGSPTADSEEIHAIPLKDAAALEQSLGDRDPFARQQELEHQCRLAPDLAERFRADFANEGNTLRRLKDRFRVICHKRQIPLNLSRRPATGASRVVLRPGPGPVTGPDALPHLDYKDFEEVPPEHLGPASFLLSGLTAENFTFEANRLGASLHRTMPEPDEFALLAAHQPLLLGTASQFLQQILVTRAAVMRPGALEKARDLAVQAQVAASPPAASPDASPAAECPEANDAKPRAPAGDTQPPAAASSGLTAKERTDAVFGTPSGVALRLAPSAARREEEGRTPAAQTEV